MCQIHIIKYDSFIANQDIVSEHIASGAASNDHGFSALFISEEGRHSLVRGLDWELIHDIMLVNNDWDQVILHQRFTTQGEATLANSHLWQVGGFFYCHNGVLRNPASNKFEVDSQLIGLHLEGGDVWEAIRFCQGEEYANVFIVNPDKKKLWISRSKDNTLFTDGSGQYSTRKLSGVIDQPVDEYSVSTISLAIEDYDVWGTSYQMPETYEEARLASIGGDSPLYTEGEIEELEAQLYEAMSDEDQHAVQRISYLLDKAQGNG